MYFNSNPYARTYSEKIQSLPMDLAHPSDQVPSVVKFDFDWNYDDRGEYFLISVKGSEKGNFLDRVKTVFVDNSLCSVSVAITAADTGHVVVAPPYSQGAYQIFTMGKDFSVERAENPNANIDYFSTTIFLANVALSESEYESYVPYVAPAVTKADVTETDSQTLTYDLANVSQDIDLLANLSHFNTDIQVTEVQIRFVRATNVDAANLSALQFSMLGNPPPGGLQNTCVLTNFSHDPSNSDTLPPKGALLASFTTTPNIARTPIGDGIGVRIETTRGGTAVTGTFVFEISIVGTLKGN